MRRKRSGRGLFSSRLFDYLRLLQSLSFELPIVGEPDRYLRNVRCNECVNEIESAERYNVEEDNDDEEAPLRRSVHTQLCCCKWRPQPA